ncbi:hypothetical protein BP6252_09743 [Coleophoma cylindrospora]|uniref:Kinase n=1 Tax=Coleophoma cylindrospora TaxID=1849047 RepID=A0A3D8QWN6_9HELO|nr:hypothetical protein BP6252_09743 [Coleophoma cylindrospora]
MSIPPSEPEHVALTSLVKPEQGQEISRDGDHNTNQQSSTPHSRPPSMSLLTQALAATKDKGDTAPNALGENNFANTPADSNSLPIPTTEEQSNGIHSLVQFGNPSFDMATITTSTAHPSGTALSAGASPTSSPMKFNFYDMNDINSLLRSHRDNLSRARGRGSSLERTDRERRLPALPKGSTNSGDTGFNTPPAPPSPTTLGSITTTPPLDGVRARYRSWRDARPGTGIEKAWSIGGQGIDDAQGVEKSITEAMTGVEPNNRSRKASHSMRFFKEGLPEDKTKKVDKKGRPSKTGTSRGKDGSSLDAVSTSTPPILEDGSPEALRSPTDKPESFAIPTDASEAGIDDRIKALPAQLLADIRSPHNLTPGAWKDSFSQGIPMQEAEKHKGVWIDTDSPSPERSHRKPDDDRATAEATQGDDDEHELSSPLKSGDEDDSGEEQVSSAVFVPHKTPHESPQRERDGFNYPTTLKKPWSEDRVRSDESDSNAQEWLEEHEVPSREIDDDYVDREATPQPDVPSVSVKPATSAEKSSQAVESYAQPEIERKRQQPDDAGYISKDDYESSQTEDDQDVTPTGSLKQTRVLKDLTHVHDHQEKSKAPLEAIELIPYKHQVGGHTTMWRFSKRAVCKQLNNRENEFYEKIERYHPHLLKFLPRYIGVLNVTFEKQQRKKSSRKDGADANLEKGQENGASGTEDHRVDSKAVSPAANSQVSNGDERPRMISQSLQSSSVPVPTVTFADNRHIIPTSFLRPHPHLIGPQHRSKSDTTTLATTRTGLNQSQPPLPESDFTFRPPLSDKHAASWGATSVNKDLRNQIFSEAFLRKPIPIHRHKKPGSQNRALPNRHGATLRPSISETSLKLLHPAETAQPVQPPEESMRRRAMKTAAERRTSGTAPLAMTGTQPSAAMNGHAQRVEEGEENMDERTGTSAPEHEILHGQGAPKNSLRPRRYSSGGLRRKPKEVAEDRGNLKYFVEADDAGYKGDEEDVFAMDPEPTRQPLEKSVTATATEASIEANTDGTGDQKVDYNTAPPSGTMLPAAPASSQKLLDIPRPVNPTTARTQRDQRVEYFLLLEDLTAGMKKPCIMDLKMGTRQYGVEANEKKQKSQRQKCKETTSQELGVRVCGLQVWDVKTQSYIFQDKYFGRDLKVGRDFQDALTRFLYDGVDYASVLRHIPTILRKLSQLEVLIRGLVGYRFYAASLLVFYDGDTQQEDESDSTAGERDGGGIKKKKEIDFKIADFANCVTKEGLNMSEKPCPPRHPELPDNGFLRGLRSLRRYFLAIQKEIRAKEMGLRRYDGDEEGELNAADEDDEGAISY